VEPSFRRPSQIFVRIRDGYTRGTGENGTYRDFSTCSVTTIGALPRRVDQRRVDPAARSEQVGVHKCAMTGSVLAPPSLVPDARRSRSSSSAYAWLPHARAHGSCLAHRVRVGHPEPCSVCQDPVATLSARTMCGSKCVASRMYLTSATSPAMSTDPRSTPRTDRTRSRTGKPIKPEGDRQLRHDEHDVGDRVRHRHPHDAPLNSDEERWIDDGRNR